MLLSSDGGDGARDNRLLPLQVGLSRTPVSTTMARRPFTSRPFFL